MIALLLLAACDTPPDANTPAATTPSDLTLREWTPAAERDAQLEPLDAPRLLRRLSLDLRGVLPTAEELDAVEADPAAVDRYRDAYIDDPRFEERLVAVLGERWFTQVDDFLIEAREFPALATHPELEYAWERAVGQEPLRLMARIAAEDRPWTEIVTTDTTMANEVLASTWPVEWTEGDTGWKEVRYTDDRPPAGILSTNGLWWRYYTTFTNYNRMRVGALGRLLVCVDFLSRPVSFTQTVSLGTDDGITEALRGNPYCQGCHSALDPVAASLFGFWTPQEYNNDETTHYHAERELIGEALLGVEPAWFGQPLSGLADLGVHVAADPRFQRCTAESVAEMYWRRDLTVDDFDRVEPLRAALAASGTLKPVIAAATDAAVYRAGAQLDGDDEPTARLMDVTLLASVLEDLVGFTWEWDGFDQLRNDTWGYRILGGGVDGAYVTRAQRTPGLTWERVIARVAEAAGTSVVATDLHGDGTPRLLDRGGLAPPDPAFADQMRALRWRLLARRATDAELADDADLFAAAGGDAGDLDGAWAAVLQALLRDPDFVTY